MSSEPPRELIRIPSSPLKSPLPTATVAPTQQQTTVPRPTSMTHLPPVKKSDLPPSKGELVVKPSSYIRKGVALERFRRSKTRRFFHPYAKKVILSGDSRPLFIHLFSSSFITTPYRCLSTSTSASHKTYPIRGKVILTLLRRVQSLSRTCFPAQNHHLYSTYFRSQNSHPRLFLAGPLLFLSPTPLLVLLVPSQVLQASPPPPRYLSSSSSSVYIPRVVNQKPGY